MTTATPPFTEDDFSWIAVFLERSGIVLTWDKAYLIETRLTPLLSRWNYKSLPLLLARLRSKTDPELEAAALDAFTTNETSFFRDAHPFETLKAQILPDIITARRPIKRLRVWSAACSTGQEPYSLAILLRQEFPETASWEVEILATDLSRDALATAKEGWYRNHEIARGIDESLRRRYFIADGRGFRVSEELRNMVRFESFNLVTGRRSDGPFDVILLRNVLIYFDDPVKQGVLRRMHTVLAPDGALLLGGAEAACRMPEGLYEAQRAARTTWHIPTRGVR